MKHEWYHDTRIEELFHNKDKEIVQHFSKEMSYHTLQYNMDSQIKTTVIPQSITGTKKRDDNFQCYPQHDIESAPSNISMSLKRHINNLPEWKRLLIQNAKEINTEESLIALIQNKREIIITPDGSKASTTSGGAWIFYKQQGKYLDRRSQSRLRNHNRNTLPSSRDIQTAFSTNIPRGIL